HTSIWCGWLARLRYTDGLKRPPSSQDALTTHLISIRSPTTHSCSIMATGLCNPASSPLRLAAPLSRSSPQAVSAFVCVGRFTGSPLRTEQRRLRLSRAIPGGGSPAGGRLLVRCGIASVNQAEFAEVVLKSEVPVLVEFVANWCGPCRLISPVIEWASQNDLESVKKATDWKERDLIGHGCILTALSDVLFDVYSISTFLTSKALWDELDRKYNTEDQDDLLRAIAIEEEHRKEKPRMLVEASANFMRNRSLRYCSLSLAPPPCAGLLTDEVAIFVRVRYHSPVFRLLESPLNALSPVFDFMVNVVGVMEYADRLKVVKIDHDANPQLIEQYKVYGLPALILFKDGQEVPESRREGAVSKAKLKEYLESLLESITVA
ncbi:hypothetical protein Taro_047968, partial [Colocasia esculenta]|nr:hypothetical protein [Colocasia esculenta]